MPADTDALLGRSLENGRYRIVSLLGRGGMGAVYLARDARLDADVVLKVPQRELLAKPEAAERFRREIKAMVRLSHPHIVKVIDLGEHDGLPFVVMQYLPGGSLRDRMRDEGPMPPEGLWAWLPDVAAALDYIHAEGYQHRDVKPDNILLDAQGHAYVSDFGLVRAAAGTAAQFTVDLTGTQQILGTPLYLAPEICGGKDHDGRVDQYSLAATVYHWLCGRPPFEGPTPAVVMALHLAQAPSPPKQWLPSLTVATEQALLRGLAKEPAQRFADCGTFARAVLAGIPAPPRARPSSADVSLPSPAESFSRTVLAGIPEALPARPSSAEVKLPTAAETMRVICPSCRKVLRVAARAAGKKSKCPTCQTVFPVSREVAAAAVPAPVSIPPPPSNPFTLTPPPAHTLTGARRPQPMPVALFLGGGAAAVALLMVLVVWAVLGGRGPSEPTRLAGNTTHAKDSRPAEPAKDKEGNGSQERSSGSKLTPPDKEKNPSQQKGNSGNNPPPPAKEFMNSVGMKLVLVGHPSSFDR